ncbi:MAG: cation-translocating P-type ATPase [Roseiarcus sp.]|jgi:Ca2+-transporting ATPase
MTDEHSVKGLTERQAAERLAAEGPNLLPRSGRRNFLRLVLEVLREPMFALLLVAGAIYLVLGDIREAAILFLFACTSVGIAIVQEARTERVLESLRDLTSPRALVIRDGEERRIPGAEVVRGDLIVLAEGDRVPADATVVAGHDLLTDESLLTGESAPVRKIAATADAASAGQPGGDDLPYVYSGSLVARGRGRAVVTATGGRSEIGKIGVAITSIAAEPPRLQKETGRLVKRFAAISLSASALAVLLYGTLRGHWFDAALSGIALGMSMLPEEIPLVLTVFMVMGAWRISRARVLTRRISAIESLGAATVLCTDKTGTLTQNRMTIAELCAVESDWRREAGAEFSPPAATLLDCGVLASAREPFDPMEKAFYALRAKTRASDDDAHRGLTLEREYGVRPELLAAVNVWIDGQGARFATAKGAPEAIADLCSLAAPEHERLGRLVDQMALGGMRVLAVARAALTPDIALSATPRGLPFALLGLVGLADPLRDSVPAAVTECRSAGVRVVMITGDYPETARAIAAAAGIDATEIVTGPQIEAIDDAELARRARAATIFARATPQHKLRIVNALKANGEVVAMTGDGVNDAPSLKAAHVGVAMGGRGTDVAREAASLVLLDDDFASIVAAIRLGRRIYDNLRKAIAYILAIHVPIAGLALAPLLFNLPLIFWPLHIAFLELVIDPTCSIVFEAEGEEVDVMRRPPRAPDERLLSGTFIAWSLAQGAVALVFVAVLFVLALNQRLPETDARALAFAALVAVNLGLALVNRSQDPRPWAALVRRNRAFWWVAGGSTALLAAIIAFEPTRALFRFGPLHLNDVAVAAASGVVVLFGLDLAKRWIAPRLTRSLRGAG